jgi:hypothetical protein
MAFILVEEEVLFDRLAAKREDLLPSLVARRLSSSALFVERIEDDVAIALFC